MVELLYKFIYWIADIHDKILTYNDVGGYYFTDKQLHFIIVGAAGMVLIFVLYPLFKLLAKTGHTMVIAWLYVFTVLVTLTFAIEIGQWLSGTGSMEMADVTSGIAGFLVMFFIFAVIRGLFHAIRRLFRPQEEEY